MNDDCMFFYMEGFGELYLQQKLTEIAIRINEKFDDSYKRINGKYHWGILDKNGKDYLALGRIRPDQFCYRGSRRDIDDQIVLRRHATNATPESLRIVPHITFEFTPFK